MRVYEVKVQLETVSTLASSRDQYKQINKVKQSVLRIWLSDISGGFNAGLVLVMLWTECLPKLTFYSLSFQNAVCVGIQDQSITRMKALLNGNDQENCFKG